MTSDQQQELREIIIELRNDISRMSERQNEMNENIKKIKEAIYNPDEGLYARIKSLEQWKESSQKFICHSINSRRLSYVNYLQVFYQLNLTTTQNVL